MRVFLGVLAVLFFMLRLPAQSGSGIPSNFFPALELITLGDAELRFGRTELALQNYNNALAMAPDFAEAYVHRGRLYAVTGRQQEAALDFQQALQLNPYAALFLDPQRRLLMLKTDYRNSSDDPIQQVLSNPYQPGLSYSITDRNLLEGHFDSSLLAAKVRLQTHPDDTEALIQATLSYYFLNQPDAGHSYIDRAIALDPLSAVAADSKGMLLKKEKRYAEARKWFISAITIDTLYAISYCHLGYLSKLEGDTVAALQWFDKALHIHPSYQQAILMRSTIKSAQLDYTGALSDLQLLNDSETTDHALYNEAVLTKQTGNYHQAARLYENLLQKNPDDVYLLNATGNLYNFFGDYELAVFYYTRALQLKPDYHTARYNLGLTYLLQLRHIKACEELRDAELNNVPGAAAAVRCNCNGF